MFEDWSDGGGHLAEVDVALGELVVHVLRILQVRLRLDQLDLFLLQLLGQGLRKLDALLRRCY